LDRNENTNALDNRQNLRILAIFLIVQFTGLLIATQVYNGLPIQSVKALSSQTPQYTPITFVLTYAGIFTILTLLLIFLMRRGSSRILLIFEALAVLVGSFFLFSWIIGILPFYFPQVSLFGSVILQLAVPAILALSILAIKYKVPRSRNFVTVVSVIGIGMTIGFFIGFTLGLAFMFVLAIYDYIAVFITKHMVAMGQAALQMNLALMVVTNEGEALPRASLTKEQLQNYNKQKPFLDKNYRSTMHELKGRNLVPILMPRGLGNGDMAVPLMLAVAAYTQFLNFTVSLVIILGGAFGLILTFEILKRRRRMLPAIPPLLFGILVALGVYFLISAL
jgi:presenilin-like A22 family membrane protease